MVKWVHYCTGLGCCRAGAEDVVGVVVVDEVGAGSEDPPCRCSSTQRGRQAGCWGCGWH